MLAAITTRRFAANYFATLLFIGLCYWLITDYSDFHEGMLQARWDLAPFGIDGGLSIQQLFVTLIVVYAVALVPYYARYTWLHSKSFVFVRGVWMGSRRRKARISPKTKQAGLALLLKFYFAPLMLNWCLLHIADMTGALLNARDGMEAGFPARALFDSGLYWSLFQLILFVDTFLFTIGYILEVPALGNRIRSVDPTFFGWFVCLACYPPFNEFTARFLPWHSVDFPQLDNDVLHFSLNIVLLLSLAVFSWASVALGFKASNLTNRGIVTHGPYAFVRHPAYAAKTFAWLLGALPGVAAAFMTDWRSGIYAVVAFGGWMLIYVFRALTEERHLLMLDNGYAQYMDRVPYRFIPGVI
jgi:protein-S-isoprenylcysteine O-methyltransferase Ste14